MAQFHGTTILAVRKDGRVALGGDGQVSIGDTIVKATANKVRTLKGGKVLAGFSEPNNKGLDIAGKPGDPVLAAASGRVMYTGTGIRGYGKLIVIKHDNNFNSVYAHNREILVKEGQNVTRGQRIAELGDTDADTPKLHFEIRKSGKPVDPAKYLPPS